MINFIAPLFYLTVPYSPTKSLLTDNGMRGTHMSRTPEGKVKDKVVGILKTAGAYYFFPATGGFGRSGVPDIVACYRGQFIGIECKAGKGVLTPLQRLELHKIAAAHGLALVVDETSTYLVADALAACDKQPLPETLTNLTF